MTQAFQMGKGRQSLANVPSASRRQTQTASKMLAARCRNSLYYIPADLNA
jgi:hypothetical protein